MTEKIKQPKWVEIGMKDIGIKEVLGPKNNPVIIGWLKKLKSWITSDESAWCGVWVAHCMQDAGLPVAPTWYRAKAWLEWGRKLDRPVYGCVVVFTRIGGGHVGFVVGKNKKGQLMVLGGNQKDMVCILPFDMARVAGYRYPIGYSTLFSSNELPVIDSQLAASVNEA